MQSDMGVLDDFEFSLPDEDFKALYFVMGQPRKIDAAIEHVGTLGEELREKYAHTILRLTLNPNPNPNPTLILKPQCNP